MDYPAALAALDERGSDKRIGPTLERIRHLAELLDHPEHAEPAIHITGTNGKTTTARMISSLLAALGLAAGTYTSPHLQDVRERVAAAGRPISMQEFAETWTYLDPYFAEVDRALPSPVTYFEALTALAFTWFAELPVDVAVLEVGMGGTWDATNLVNADVAVINRVALDHPQLGSTPAAVATEKAGIIKPAATAVSQRQESAALEVIRARVAEVGASLLLQGDEFDVSARRHALGGQLLHLRTPAGTVSDVFLPLYGRHQADNAAAALTAVQAFLGERELGDDVVREGFAAVTSPGRLEVVGHGPLVVLDGAHNPAGAQALAAAMLEEFVVDRRTVVLACMGDKDVRGIIEGLAPALGRLIVTQGSAARSAPAEQLRKEAETLGLEAELIPDLEEAVRGAIAAAGAGEAVVVTGSLYTVGEARELLLGPGPA